MFLEYVKIVNFRRYYGVCDFNLGFTDEKNVSIFVADNNAGKSSLVNALSWCLYGDEFHDSKNRSELKCNVEALSDAEKEDDNPQAKVLVHLRFYNINEEGDKEYFKITRSLTFHKFGDADWTEEMSDEVIFEDNMANISKDEYAEMKIKELIPENMFKYFFFNGTSISNYFKYDDNTFNLKDSIDNVSQLDLINKVYNQLKGTLTKLNNDFKDNKHDDEDDLLDEINKKKEELRKEKEDRETYKKNQSNAARKKYEYDEKLKKIKATEVKKLVKDREKYENEKKDIKSRIDENKIKYENLILELFPLCAIFEPLYESYIIVGNSIEKNAIPTDVREQILKIIEDEGKCICGLDLKEHPECLIEVNNKLKGESRENSLYRQEYKHIGEVLRKLRKLPDIENIKEDINKDTDHLELINSKLDDISKKLLDSDEEKVKEYENSFNKYKSLEEKYSKKLEKSSIRINNLKKEINELQIEADEITYKNSKLLEIKSKMTFCNELIDVIDDLKNGVRKHIRSKVNDKTKNQFISIKSDEYSDVSIDEDYGVNIVEIDGRVVVPDDLSDGTESLLALSFIMALHSIKGIDFPLIIDAPFEKLDRKSRIDFVNGLHDFTNDKQVIFLFTDSQYTEEVRSHMLKIVLDEFKLIKKGSKKTEIKHVI